MMRSSPPLCVNSRSSSIMSRRPLHLMKDTSMSIRSAETISFLSSVNICGSCTAPVKSELCAMEVSGRMISALSSSASTLFFLSKSARSCSARSATESVSKSASFVSVIMVDTMRLTSST